MKEIEVVVWVEICADGSKQFELVCPDSGGKCLDYFHTEDEVRDYCKSHGYVIVEWMRD